MSLQNGPSNSESYLSYSIRYNFLSSSRSSEVKWKKVFYPNANPLKNTNEHLCQYLFQTTLHICPYQNSQLNNVI